MKKKLTCCVLIMEDVTIALGTLFFFRQGLLWPFRLPDMAGKKKIISRKVCVTSAKSKSPDVQAWAFTALGSPGPETIDEDIQINFETMKGFPLSDSDTSTYEPAFRSSLSAITGSKPIFTGFTGFHTGSPLFKAPPVTGSHIGLHAITGPLPVTGSHTSSPTFTGSRPVTGSHTNSYAFTGSLPDNGSHTSYQTSCIFRFLARHWSHTSRGNHLQKVNMRSETRTKLVPDATPWQHSYAAAQL